MAEPEKKTRGKQKIEIERIENAKDRLITFSKRRSGIHKKASELVTLTGAEVGVLIFSPTGKPYSYGHPSFEAISNRLMGVNLPPNYNTHPLVEARRKLRIHDLSRLHNEHLQQLEAEKDRGKMLKETTGGKERGWWDIPIENLSVEELHHMDAAFEEVSKSLLNKIQEKSLNGDGGEASSPSLPPSNPNQPRTQLPTIPEETHSSTFPHGSNYSFDELDQL